MCVSDSFRREDDTQLQKRVNGIHNAPVHLCFCIAMMMSMMMIVVPFVVYGDGWVKMLFLW